MSGTLSDLNDLDRLLHEPARLMIVTILYAAGQADFLYLLRETGLSKGNLSAHLTRLEQAGYLSIEKRFRGKVPQTLCSLTENGRAAFEAYRERLKRIAASL
ncbi:MAG TPA: transcriptional regulator [Anaerolineaceae bacterium]|nr:transcriptional regulator [Anaerolineaceae bacterium]HPN51346.1 transcriptional regulator [Anaerolineaceae bacterium]